MTHHITLIAGDGIGPEVTAAVVMILERAGLQVEWDAHAAGVTALEKFGDTLPTGLLESIRRNKVALKGPVTTPVGGGFTSVNVGLRKALDLFVNLRPVWNIPSVPSRYQGVDLVIVRENTEDLYSGLEHEVVPGVVESLKIITEAATARAATFAFEYARRHGRRRVTVVHKANIMKLGDGLFLRTVQRIAAQYPEIRCDERIVDAACMHLVINPAQFDVLLMPNLYGDIVSDLCAGLVGGLGVVQEPISVRRSACSRRCTAARQTSRARVSRTDGPSALGGADVAAHQRRGDCRSDHGRARGGAVGRCQDAGSRRHRRDDRVCRGDLSAALVL
jgi:isocitrate dehydrogenase (NAD+)